MKKKKPTFTGKMRIRRGDLVVVNAGKDRGAGGKPLRVLPAAAPGVVAAIANAKLVDAAAEELTLIAGQRAVVTRAKKSIARFKLRAGMPIGCRVTLRGDRMYEFLDRLMNVALPRVRDFRGVPTRAFDGRGNYTLGVKGHLIFPEIDPTKIDKSKRL